MEWKLIISHEFLDSSDPIQPSRTQQDTQVDPNPLLAISHGDLMPRIPLRSHTTHRQHILSHISAVFRL